MHEIHVVETLLQKAIQKASATNSKRITGLHIVIGELSSCTDEVIQSKWSDISRGTIADNAKLHFHRVQAEVQCMACFTKYHPENGEIVCPACKSVGAKILAGEELSVESIDAE